MSEIIKGCLGFKGEKGEPGEIQRSDIVDNLNSDSAIKVLSAKQGKILESSKADKTTTTDLQNQINGLASGSPKGSYSTISDLVTANPETGVYVIQVDGHIYSWTKNAENAIDLGVYQSTQVEYKVNQFLENNLGFIENDNTKCNIFTNTNTTPNSFINSNGTITEVNDFMLSNYLPVNPSSHIITNLENGNTVAYGFYDINKNFISRTVNVVECNVPLNAYYLRISCNVSKYNILEIYENTIIPSIKYPYTPFVRNIPIIKSISKAKLLRGGIIISELSNNNTMTISVLANTIVYSENYFATLNEATYSLPINKAIFVNCKTGNLEVQDFNRNTINHTTYYNDMLFLGFNNTGIMYTYDYEPNTAIVNKKGFMTYSKIADAGKVLSNKGIIKIYEGEYDETLEFWSKEINLIGIGNKRNIIIFNTNGNYPTPPLEMSKGTIKNLTVYAKFNGTYTTTEWSAYALHADDDNMANGSLIMNNVIFKSDFNCPVGMGTRKNNYIEFNECDFISTVDRNNENIPTKGGGLFLHDGNNAELYGTADIVIKNCYFENISMKYILRLYRIHEENTMNLTFINNSFWSRDFEGENIINNQGNALENWNFTYASHGNNIDTLNKS